MTERRHSTWHHDEPRWDTPGLMPEQVTVDRSDHDDRPAIYGPKGEVLRWHSDRHPIGFQRRSR